MLSSAILNAASIISSLMEFKTFFSLVSICFFAISNLRATAFLISDLESSNNFLLVVSADFINSSAFKILFLCSLSDLAKIDLASSNNLLASSISPRIVFALLSKRLMIIFGTLK